MSRARTVLPTFLQLPNALITEGTYSEGPIPPTPNGSLGLAASVVPFPIGERRAGGGNKQLKLFNLTTLRYLIKENKAIKGH